MAVFERRFGIARWFLWPGIPGTRHTGIIRFWQQLEKPTAGMPVFISAGIPVIKCATQKNVCRAPLKSVATVVRRRPKGELGRSPNMAVSEFVGVVLVVPVYRSYLNAGIPVGDVRRKCRLIGEWSRGLCSGTKTGLQRHEIQPQSALSRDAPASQRPYGLCLFIPRTGNVVERDELGLPSCCRPRYTGTHATKDAATPQE